MITTVIFDLDGTLLDTSAGVLESVRYTISQLGLPELREEELMSFIGPPLRSSFVNTCGCTQEEAQRATTVFRAHYQAGAVLKARPYDGIAELCRTLEDSGFRMGVATNKPQRFAVPLLEHFGLKRFCTVIQGADEGGKKSKAELICGCMEELGAEPSETVLVGDTDNDAIGAQQAGVAFLAVLFGFGFRTPEELESCACIGAAETPMQIAEILRKENGR